MHIKLPTISTWRRNCGAQLTLGVQTVHHALHDVDLVFDGEVDKVGIDEHVEGRPELRVVLEEERRGRCRSAIPSHKPQSGHVEVERPADNSRPQTGVTHVHTHTRLVTEDTQSVQYECTENQRNAAEHNTAAGSVVQGVPSHTDNTFEFTHISLTLMFCGSFTFFFFPFSLSFFFLEKAVKCAVFKNPSKLKSLLLPL